MKKKPTTTTKKGRPKVPPKIEALILLRSRRRCSLCWGLKGALKVREGQIAHVDRDHSNNAHENLAFLCLPHHNRYDSKTSVSKNFTPKELVTYRNELYKLMERLPGNEKRGVVKESGRQPPTISLELFDRRLAAYHVVTDYLASVVRDATVSLKQLEDFGVASKDYVFLFDDAAREYVDTLYQKGVELRGVQQRMETEKSRGYPDPKAFEILLDREAELLKYFFAQFPESRQCFKQYMNL